MSVVTHLDRHRYRNKLALATLMIGAFVVGTAELVVVGVLPLIATDMSVSISTTGQLVTSYALGISVGGPVLNALTVRFGRRFLAWLCLATYIAGNVLAVAAVGFGMLVVARFITGSVHGLFIGVATVVAAGIVPPEQRGRAISMVFGGVAVATVLGIPLGTLIGQAMGWQATFIAIIILGGLALAATLAFVPSVESSDTGGFAAQARCAFAPRVLAMLAVGFMLMAGQFTVFTYITPYLEEITGISGGLVSAFLLAFGIASAAGTFLGGISADRSPTTTLWAGNMLVVLTLGVLYLVGATPVLVALTMGIWGLLMFAIFPPLQLRVISLAGIGGNLAATLSASAANAGIAVGAVIGGWLVASQGVESIVPVGLLICAVAVPATWATKWLVPPEEGKACRIVAPGVVEPATVPADVK
ncbi:MFS transporter [Actinophytocola sp.]|uniref:MFS transporter n=1 Tax=Actinophytocola sp. TaxID=1872138 RepID=UPI002ED4FC37